MQKRVNAKTRATQVPHTSSKTRAFPKMVFCHERQIHTPQGVQVAIVTVTRDSGKVQRTTAPVEEREMFFKKIKPRNTPGVITFSPVSFNQSYANSYVTKLKAVTDKNMINFRHPPGKAYVR